MGRESDTYLPAALRCTGETESDFNETLDLVNECKFDGAFTFAFSPRENTPAALMKETVSEEVKMDRLHRLNEIVNKYSNLNNSKLMNKVVKCLVTDVSEKDKNKVCGYTENMKLVNIKGEVIGINSLKIYIYYIICFVLFFMKKNFLIDFFYFLKIIEYFFII